MQINVTSEFGIIIRKASLKEKHLLVSDIVKHMESQPLDESEQLLSFEPSFGQEALDVFTSRLISIGLEYFEDFFEFSGAFPPWCKFKAELNSTNTP